jgi:hypothetical protein
MSVRETNVKGYIYIHVHVTNIVRFVVLVRCEHSRSDWLPLFNVQHVRSYGRTAWCGSRAAACRAPEGFLNAWQVITQKLHFFLILLYTRLEKWPAVAGPFLAPAEDMCPSRTALHCTALWIHSAQAISQTSIYDLKGRKDDFLDRCA